MVVSCGELAAPIDDGFVGCIGGHVGRWVGCLCCKARFGMYIKDEDPHHG
jgi:hypothetical protein